MTELSRGQSSGPAKIPPPAFGPPMPTQPASPPELATQRRIAELERQLRCVQLYGYGYLLRHGGEQIALDPKDVTVVLPASRHMDDFDLHNSLHLAEERIRELERQRGEVARAAVSATFRKVAEWGLAFQSTPDQLAEDELRSIAHQIDSMEPDEMCCPVCEETECDAGCPLAGVRATDAARDSSYQGTPVTWTMADHREDKADG